MLEIADLHTYYEDNYVLKGISLKVNNNSAVALLGRNGMGKTTVIRTIMNFITPRQGMIKFKGEDITGLPSYEIAQKGIGLVPQGRHIFPSLSVEENLLVARSQAKSAAWSLEKVYDLFPILNERAKYKGNTLSGGQQQMLAIGRALMTNSEFLLMDEPSEGLAPLVVREVTNIISQLKNSGFSILLVEQNLTMALELADYIYIVSKGMIVYESTPEELRKDEEAWVKHLGISG